MYPGDVARSDSLPNVRTHLAPLASLSRLAISLSRLLKRDARPRSCSSASLIARSCLPRSLARSSAEVSVLPVEAPAVKLLDEEPINWEFTADPNFLWTDNGAPAAPDFPVQVGVAKLSRLLSILDSRKASAALCATLEACSSILALSSSWAFMIISWKLSIHIGFHTSKEIRHDQVSQDNCASKYRFHRAILPSVNHIFSISCLVKASLTFQAYDFSSHGPLCLEKLSEAFLTSGKDEQFSEDYLDDLLPVPAEVKTHQGKFKRFFPSVSLMSDFPSVSLKRVDTDFLHSDIVVTIDVKHASLMALQPDPIIGTTWLVLARKIQNFDMFAFY
ncbi:hypothetical protein M5K25_023804 [Dendrobium thyrsiflorum]|uniref:Uncharacterized protein n=1 Tax=Dendrobium thyrsiflorum TaxID=117978 RepID=A0ABD0U0J7_DENTH